VLWAEREGSGPRLALVHGFASISQRGNQIVSGVAAGDVLVADARRALPDGTRVRPILR